MLKEDRFEFSISEAYHENSKYHLARLQPPTLSAPDPAQTSEAFKTYRRAPVIPLPEDFSAGSLSLEEAITTRRSVREFSGDAITIQELAKLLFLTNGVTTAQTNDAVTYFFRAAPSAGALYPVEIYPVVFSVTSVEPGLYHYNVRDHSLELLRAGDHRQTVHDDCLFHELILTANVVLLATAVFQRVKQKYGERGYRFALLEAGHIMQNSCLVATAMELGAVTLGGFLDDKLNALIGVDGVDEAMVYAAAIGCRSPSNES
jgi:SagB-type dehydrogenase family enzyme